MDFLLETNPAFLIIPINTTEFVFYNSLQHRASRLSYLEMRILDMYYTYQDKDYILSQFNEDKKETPAEALRAIDNHKLLLCEDIHDADSYQPVFPSSYYLHLTYKCNLKCTYCYNKNIRKENVSILTLPEWEIIIDKIAPFAKIITLTGNEFHTCSKCKVKYICGGGCPATAYKFYGEKIGPNHLTCRLNYINSINKLKSLNNRL